MVTNICLTNGPNIVLLSLNIRVIKKNVASPDLCKNKRPGIGQSSVCVSLKVFSSDSLLYFIFFKTFQAYWDIHLTASYLKFYNPKGRLFHQGHFFSEAHCNTLKSDYHFEVKQRL